MFHFIINRYSIAATATLVIKSPVAGMVEDCCALYDGVSDQINSRGFLRDLFE